MVDMYYFKENINFMNILNKNFNHFQKYTFQVSSQYDKANKFYYDQAYLKF